MFNILFAAGFNLWNLDLWYALPAILAVSLVYGATRHEEIKPILIHSVRVVLLIVAFMMIVFGVMELVRWFFP